MTSYQLPKPALNWDANGAPHSEQFNDVYFDRESGLEETHFVFLEHNQLANRFERIFSHINSNTFTIAETGFGTGLNFLCAWQLWQEKNLANNQNKRLHFISVEKYPLSKEQLKTALTMWPSLKLHADELVDAYPVICKGLHRIELDHGQVQLTLWFGEANEGFANLNADIDAWFLDGFAPSKNPDMWNEQLFNNINRLSHTGTTFSTFTAAGIVRRGLQSVGFDIQKVKGFGKKREMLIGSLIEQKLTPSQRACGGLAWFNNRPELNIQLQTASSTDMSVLVIGAGLAGCHTAHALAKKGVDVVILDQHDSIANEASGNPQGILYPKLAGQDSASNRFYLTSYLYANRVLNQIESTNKYTSQTTQHTNSIWQQIGLEQRPTSDKEQAKFIKLFANDIYPESVVRKADNGAIFLPLSGWVSPAEWCHHIIKHPNITFRGKSKVTNLQQVSSKDDIYWNVTSNNERETERFSHVVFCTANHNDIVSKFIELPTQAIRGQVSSLPLEETLHLDKVLCQNGYVSPPLQQHTNTKATLYFGSSYGLKDNNTKVTLDDHNSNLTKLTQLLPSYNWAPYLNKCEGRVSFRCTVSDYVPIIGPVPQVDMFLKNYRKLSKNAKWKSSNVVQHIPNLYINIGHGSRGLISTPLAGEYIAALICNEASVYERSIEHVIHPARFLVRELKKSQSE